MSRYFHRTTVRAAAAILKGGFKDGMGRYLTVHVSSGVWISNVPLNENEGAEGDVLLTVEVPRKLIEPYEWVEEGKGYREFLVPAKVLNMHGRIVRIQQDEFHTLEAGEKKNLGINVLKRLAKALGVPVTGGAGRIGRGKLP